MSALPELDSAVFFLRQGEEARHSRVVAHVRDKAMDLLDAVSAGSPMSTNGGGKALYFTPEKAQRLLAAADALRSAA
jgi:hypothetical protein